jgi:hypothetical protein
MSITQIIWNHTGILTMTTNFLFTKEQVAHIKEQQRIDAEAANIRATKRRNDAEDRATAKAEAKDE